MGRLEVALVVCFVGLVNSLTVKSLPVGLAAFSGLVGLGLLGVVEFIVRTVQQWR